MSNEVRVPEVVVARLRSHGRALFWPSLALMAISGGSAYFVGVLPAAWEKTAIIVSAFLFGILLWLIPLLAWMGRNYTITTRRIVLRSGFFVRVRQELLHSRGYDVLVRQNALQGAFGCGDVQINTGLEHPIILKDVPNADLVQEALHDLMEASVNPIAARRQHEQSLPSDETARWGSR
jgi:membrane protein YdbS with pleckstrin-like domain